MIEIGSVTSANTNLTAGGAAPIDHSFSPYVGGGSSADTGTSVMSFGDFLDMVNPLQHIPVVSSVYRAATGDSINPVSRISGDALYGGVLGLASAGLSALGAIGDEAVAAANDGQSASMMMASLFGGGSEDTSGVQLASDAVVPAEAVAAQSVPEAAPQVALLQTPATQSPILEIPTFAPPASPVTASVVPDVLASPVVPTPTPVLASSEGAVGAGTQGMPLDRSKAAYGGGIDSTMMERAQQNQTLALALAGGARALQSQHDLRNNRFAVQAGTSASGTVASPMETLQAMKGVNQYQSAGQSLPVAGSSVNITN